MSFSFARSSLSHRRPLNLARFATWIAVVLLLSGCTGGKADGDTGQRPAETASETVAAQEVGDAAAGDILMFVPLAVAEKDGETLVFLSGGVVQPLAERHASSRDAYRPTTDAGGHPVAYFTFDDGPSEYTPQILDVLARHSAHATFFMVGSGAHEHPDLVKSVRAHGHTIGNHTWSHPQLTKKDDQSVVSEIDRTDEAVGGSTCVRPPYGATSRRVNDIIHLGGRSAVLWDVDTRDWARPGVSAILANLRSAMHPGAVVLMHDGGGNRSQSVDALDAELSDLEAQGYRFNSLPDCA